MAVFDCVIDTKPMAKSIDHVARTVDGTTAAVVAMQTAVVKAQNDAADDVCRNVNRGFYSLIHSQISQKIAKWKSEVNSLQLQLNQQGRQLNNIRNRMERDYAMITSRYTKLFGTLNRALQRRVYELDKAAFKFAVTEIDTIENRGKQLTATVPVGQTESLATSQRLMASNIKYRGARLIDIMKDFLLDLNHQKQLTARVLLNRGIEQPDESHFMPVAVWEGVAGSREGSLQHVAMPRKFLSERTCQTLTNAFTAPDAPLEWTGTGAAPDRRVRDGFNAMLAQFDATPRMKETMAKLFASASYQTLKGN
ncbi:MAG: hypothetical protein NC338_01310 [Firmicutes bacterium]|nr:hypothetical protein [Bacillota bacterium]MCM1401028.1 hypothetical protein [Bacteroides sp.]MCM1476947.1 hypothetical protein [Bacteroides sp.]